ncbi:SWAP (Suppressor-of-White-APricot)/surpRNA-binding domain-containing protein, partial [Striga asiatica]
MVVVIIVNLVKQTRQIARVDVERHVPTQIVDERRHVSVRAHIVLDYVPVAQMLHVPCRVHQAIQKSRVSGHVLRAVLVALLERAHEVVDRDRGHLDYAAALEFYGKEAIVFRAGPELNPGPNKLGDAGDDMGVRVAAMLGLVVAFGPLQGIIEEPEHELWQARIRPDPLLPGRLHQTLEHEKRDLILEPHQIPQEKRVNPRKRLPGLGLQRLNGPKKVLEPDTGPVQQGPEEPPLVLLDHAEARVSVVVGPDGDDLGPVGPAVVGRGEGGGDGEDGARAPAGGSGQDAGRVGDPSERWKIFLHRRNEDETRVFNPMFSNLGGLGIISLIVESL